VSAARQNVHQGCNLLAVTGGSRRLFQFNVSKGRPVPAGDAAIEEGKPLPKNVVSRDWRVLLKPRLDIAWLPLDSVFVRAVALPACEPSELAGMIEFQIEKISPMPPAQVVWTVESVPHADGTGQTAVVTLASRTAVEAFLGEMESGGYTVDVLENPLLRELLASPAPADGLVLLAESAGPLPTVLAAWWTGGILREVGLLRLPVENPGPTLVAQLNGMAWAGEVAGWLSSLPDLRLVASGLDADRLLGALRDWTGRDPEVVPPRSTPDLATLTASHALHSAGPRMVPEEVRIRQRQQFVDALWLKGLGALAMTYLAGVFVYLGILTVQKSRLDTLRDDTRGMALQYTNTLQLKARVRVLQEQVALRFAALDCWNSVAEKLPETLTLTQLDFKNGRTLVLDGLTTDENRADITRFNSELRAVMIDGRPLFAEVRPATTQLRGAQLTWRFEADIRREDSTP
jgi:hypothetical protein